jgi:EAL domain-containing protein (putative c-di-GMP-specific phosphodiesterase class I)
VSTATSSSRRPSPPGGLDAAPSPGPHDNDEDERRADDRVTAPARPRGGDQRRSPPEWTKTARVGLVGGGRRQGMAMPGSVATAVLALSVAVHLLEHVDVAPVAHVVLTWVVLSLPVFYLITGGQGRAAIWTTGHRRELDTAERSAWAETRRRIQGILTTEAALTIVYQPIVDLGRDEVVGHEALARFPGGSPPDVWFGEAHAVGLGVELEVLAVSRALHGIEDGGYLSINVSPVAVASPAFRNLLRHHHAPERLVVEVTEHVMVDDYAAIAVALKAIRALGARIAVDDAGGGFASLRHVLALSPDLIKLDRSLIQGLDSDPKRRSLAASLQSFAASIGAELVAEGIERDEELDICRELGIRYGQGYLLGEPNPCPQPRRHRK